MRRYAQILKYLISGGTAAAVNIGSLYIFTDFFKWWYLFSTVVSFILAFFVSFLLQKFWTFQDKETDGVHKQLSMYFVVGLINLALNTALMYFCVDILHVWYILSQFIVTGLIAILSFFVYKHFIFAKKPQNTVSDSSN